MNIRWKKQVLVCLMVVALIISATGCGGEDGSSITVIGVLGGTPKPYPITVTDQIGREVTMEKEPQRIVSSYYISTASLLTLGLGDRLVGVEMKADTRKLYEMAAPGLLELPAVGSGKGINVEQTAATEPDLIVLPKKLQDAVPSFEALGIPVLVVDPETQADFEQCIALLGEATGTSVRANQLLQYYDDKMEEADRLTEGLEKPSVYMASGQSYLRTCTGLMYQNDLIELAGGRNVSKELQDAYWVAISAEQLLSWNPDYIFAVNYAEYPLTAIAEDKTLNSVRAIADGKVSLFPSKIEAWDYPTPSSILGVLWMIHQLHPQAYTKEQFVQEAGEFYQTFFGITVTEEDLGIQ